MLQMIFERQSDGSIAPLTPTTSDGKPRQPDGVRSFNLHQAVEVFQMGESALVALYDKFYGSLFPRLQDGEVGAFAPDQAKTAKTRRDLIKVVRFPHLSDDELDALLDICSSRGLDPWRHVYAEVRVGQRGKRELRPIVTIDAFRWLADQTKRYRGQTLPYFLDEKGNWHEGVWTDTTKPPVAAKVGVRRKGWDEPQWTVARWSSYVQYVETPRGPEVSDFWVKMDAEQLAKCAEALAFRKAFPAAIGGLYTIDEMDQADGPANPRRGHSPAVDVAGPEDLGPVEITEETPVSWKEFEDVLGDRFGFKDPEARLRVIAKLKEKLGGSGTAAVNKTFFAKALRALERAPGKYGAMAA